MDSVTPPRYARTPSPIPSPTRVPLAYRHRAQASATTPFCSFATASQKALAPSPSTLRFTFQTPAPRHPAPLRHRNHLLRRHPPKRISRAALRRRGSRSRLRMPRKRMGKHPPHRRTSRRRPRTTQKARWKSVRKMTKGMGQATTKLVVLRCWWNRAFVCTAGEEGKQEVTHSLQSSGRPTYHKRVSRDARARAIAWDWRMLSSCSGCIAQPFPPFVS